MVLSLYRKGPLRALCVSLNYLQLFSGDPLRLLQRGGHSVVSLALATDCVPRISNAQILWIIWYSESRKLVLDSMPRDQQLLTLATFVSGNGTNAYIIQWLISTLEFTGYELVCIIHQRVLSSIMYRLDHTVQHPGANEQHNFMRHTNNTRCYASHPLVHRVFMESRGWLSIDNYIQLSNVSRVDAREMRRRYNKLKRRLNIK